MVPLRLRQAYQEATRPVAVPRLHGAAAAVTPGGRGGGLEGRRCEPVVGGKLKRSRPWTRDHERWGSKEGKESNHPIGSVVQQEKRGRLRSQDWRMYCDFSCWHWGLLFFCGRGRGYRARPTVYVFYVSGDTREGVEGEMEASIVSV